MELRALAVGLGAGDLLAGLAFAQPGVGLHLLGDVDRGVEEVAHPALRVEHGRVARQPVALHELAGPGRVGHVVVLRGHRVGQARGQHLRQRGAQVVGGPRIGRGGVVGKGVEEMAAQQARARGEGGGQVVVAGRLNQ